MPTPVNVARQCLTEEATRALDEAVAVARRRNHAQTTSLHAVSALLSMPSSTLREACTRARSSAYSSRLQFRALELSVGVSLDRLPSSKSLDEPPISNSLMAAIKRSQANQRRHPESYHLQQIHGSSNCSSNQTSSILKVELKYFVLSILDDPIVSRVLGEAGFSSCNVKLAILHPPITQFSPPFSRTRCPPIFLCNLTDSDQARRSFGSLSYGREALDENCKRICEVLVRKDKKNPLLVGVCSGDALKSFCDFIERGNEGVLPTEISGLRVINIENEVIEFVVGGGSEENMSLKLHELGQIVEHSSGSGLVVNFGELKVMVTDGVVSTDAVSRLVSKLTNWLQSHKGKFWLIGAAASYETYLKFSARFPTIERDWDLNLLPITSSTPSFDGTYSKHSLMASFVPFGGFFSMPSDFQNPLNSINQSIPRCHLCNEKYEQEVAVVQKEGSLVSVADQYSEKLPSWLRIQEPETNKGLDPAKAKDDGIALNAKVAGLQKKWNDICQRLHASQAFPKLDISQSISRVPFAESSQFTTYRSYNSISDQSKNESRHATVSPRNMDIEDKITSKMQKPLTPPAENVNFKSRLFTEVSKNQQQQDESEILPNPSPRVSLANDGTTSLPMASVTTDLRLGTLDASTVHEPKTPKSQYHTKNLQHYPGSISADFDSNIETTSQQVGHSSPCSEPTSEEITRDYKLLRKYLADKVGWQNEAICTISQAVSLYRTGKATHHNINRKRDIWLTFLGPDRVGKKKIASELAEKLFGSRKNLISVDLSSLEGLNQENSILQCEERNSYDVTFRGKTVVDYIAEEMIRKPLSVVFLENVDKADILVQTSLSQAVRTGKFPNSQGREISISNMIFITTSTITERDANIPVAKNPNKFSEERIIGAKSCTMQIKVTNLTEDSRSSSDRNTKTRPDEESSDLPNKRKLVDISTDHTEREVTSTKKRAQKEPRSYLDLNLPVEDISFDDYDSDSISENSEAWLEDFFNKVDTKVVFKPFEFDTLAEKIVKDINFHFHKSFTPQTRLDIDDKVMIQILAATWVSDSKRAVEEWVENVLNPSFKEVRQKHDISAMSTVKLVACQSLPMNERAKSICLPAKVHLN